MRPSRIHTNDHFYDVVFIADTAATYSCCSLSTTRDVARHLDATHLVVNSSFAILCCRSGKRISHCCQRKEKSLQFSLLRGMRICLCAIASGIRGGGTRIFYGRLILSTPGASTVIRTQCNQQTQRLSRDYCLALSLKYMCE